MAAWKRVLVYRYNKNEVSTAVINWSRSSKYGLQGANQDQVQNEGQQKVCNSASLLLCGMRIQAHTYGTKEPEEAVAAVFQQHHVFPWNLARHVVVQLGGHGAITCAPRSRRSVWNWPWFDRHSGVQRQIR